MSGPAQWFASRLPSHWAVEGAEVLVDPDEVLVVVDLGDAALDERDRAIRMFRERTRDERMALATAGEAAFGRRVSWAARCGGEVTVFTAASVPVMTRLRMQERVVLDTLIDAGVARTRSEALAWCVRLVGEHESQWIAELRAAFRSVEEVRAKGPVSRRKRA